MHYAFNKEIIRSIRYSLTRFGAIFMIVALGAGFYAGLRMCAPDMRMTVDAYYDATAFMDVHLISTLGFSDADVEAVAALDGVSAVMPEHVADVTATIGERRATVRIHGIDCVAAAGSDTSSGKSAISSDAGYLNRPILVAGRWPERAGECVIDSSKVFANTAQLGDTVTLLDGTRSLEDTFVQTEFTVVGVVNSSYYLAFSRGTTTLGDGSIDRVVYIPDEGFIDPDVYTDLFLTVEDAADFPTFTSAYVDVVDPVIAVLEALAPMREAARLAEVKNEAQGALDEERAGYDAARAEADAKFAEAEDELATAAAKSAASEGQLADAQERYDAGVIELAAGRASAAARFSDGQTAINNGRAVLEQQQDELDRLAAALPLLQQQVTSLETTVTGLQVAYEAALSAEALGNTVEPSSAELSVQLAAARAELAAAQDEYAVQSATYAAGVAALADARVDLETEQASLDAARDETEAQFTSAERELAAAGRAIASGSAELADARQELADARAEYEAEKTDANTELADALALIEDAQAEIDAIEMPSWYVLGRDANMGYASFSGDADRIQAIAIVFPFIFFLVAALVALTTMTRMVDEERTLIGTYKALGYSKGRIAAKYLVYAGLASFTGSIFGIVIGSQVLPYTVWRAYTTMYTAPSALTPIVMPIALMSMAASVGVTLLATLVAVEATLRESPATLMLPRAPKPGKRILLERIKPLWSRFSFTRKVTARNLFRYKKRLLMTVIGIAGCTALLLTGFGLKDSIGDILAGQYGEIYLYNATIGLDSEEADVDSILAESGGFSDYLTVHVESVRIESGEGGGTSIDGYLRSPDDVNRLGDFIALRVRTTGLPVILDDSGVVITEKAADVLGVRAGDTICIEPLDVTGGTTGEDAVMLTVAGITEQYVSHYVYISPALYEEAFGDRPVCNEALGKALVVKEADKEKLSQALLERDGVTTVQFNDDITSSFDSMLESLDSVVFILILSAGMLAFIVLYNLTNINVTERQREIATIKVLGFYDSEVNAYIYRETAALTVIGCALGLALGVALERFVITTVEVDIVMFGRTIHAASFLYSAALTAIFAVIVNLAMRRRLRNIDMVESLKSVE